MDTSHVYDTLQDHNLVRSDLKAKEAGLIEGRYISHLVGGSEAYYRISNVTDEGVRIERVNAGKNLTYPGWGEGTTLTLQMVKAYLYLRDHPRDMDLRPLKMNSSRALETQNPYNEIYTDSTFRPIPAPNATEEEDELVPSRAPR